jgi:hypothetical protein
MAEIEEPGVCARVRATESASTHRLPLARRVSLDVVRIECERCGRAGSYALARLIERFGADAAMPDVLVELAQCGRRANFSRPCGARFTDLAARI